MFEFRVGSDFVWRKFSFNFQILCFVCATIACCNAVVLSGYNGGHGISYSDYEALEGYSGSTGYEGHAVLPTVAVPVHAVSAAPVHLGAALDHGVHGYEHQADHDHDYYVSVRLPFRAILLLKSIFFYIALKNICCKNVCAKPSI